MKKINFFFALLLTFIGATTSNAEELTVCEGSAKNSYVPVYGFWADTQGQKSEFIITADKLSAMAGATINQMQFHLDSHASAIWQATYEVFLKEIEESEFSITSSYNSSTATAVGKEGATIVYTGQLDATSSTMTIDFSEEFNYEGGNLLVGIYMTNKGSNCPDAIFKGIESENGSWYYTSSSGNKPQNFIPQTTFSYISSDGPALRVKDYKDGETISFGMVNPRTQKTITLTNPGTEEITVNISTSGDFTADATKTIAAKGEETVTITAPDATGTGTITFIPTDESVDAITLNLSCIIKDPDKFFEDFSGNALPDEWETVGIGSYTSYSGYEWSFAEGFATYKKSTSSESSLTNYYHSLVMPELTFTEGEKLLFKLKRNTEYSSSVSSLYVEYSADKQTWTTATDGHFASSAITDNWADCEVTIPASAKFIRFRACGVSIDDVYGGTPSQAPRMVVTAEDHNFGFVVADATYTFNVKNAGKSELTGIQITSSNEAFTIAGAPETLAAGADADVTVTMSNANKGVQSGVITITAPDQTEITLNVNGYVGDDTKLFVDFNDNAAPEGWTNKGWTFSNGAAVGGYVSGNKDSDANLISPAITVAAGDVMAIEAMGTSSMAELRVYTSADNGANWELAKNFDSEVQANTTNFTVVTLDKIAEGNYLLMFVGYAVKVNTINGFNLAALDHDIAITDSNIPTEGYEGEEYTASVTVQEKAGKDETVTARLYIDGAVVAEQEQTVAANETATIQISFTPTEAVSYKKAYIEVSYGDNSTVKTDETTISFNTMLVIDEATANTFETYSGKVKLNYTVYDGWNTIALPFMVNDLSVFGTGAKVYALTGYNDGNLQLTSATSMALATPYVLYVETATTEPIVFDNVSIYSATATEADCNTTKNGATFQGTYKPIEAGSMNITWYGVTGEGKIMKAGSSASIKAMHAYFTLPVGDEAKTIAYDGIVAGDDGTATAINALINGNSQGELYDLSGRRVEGNVKAGIYVRNGKKIVIK